MNSWLTLLRPHQWLKNLMLLFPPFLGGALTQFSFRWLVPMLAFCLASSATYIVNDIFDLDQDRCHPHKKSRPLAAGKIPVPSAWVATFVLGLAACWFAFTVSIPFLQLLLIYLGISLGYSLGFKKVPLVELFCVVSGFLLRLLAGGEAYDVVISDWLFLSVFLLALFLVSGKRLSELRHEGGGTPEQIRPVLGCYPKGFLEGCMLLSGSAVLVTYTMYVISHQSTIWVIPLSCFGLLAFWLRVLSGRGGDPTRALLKDPALFVVGVAWLVLVGWWTYG
ncbi:MAG: decaprenyl-phosphate phosphoribosyltransferase [Geothermobacteraceae bacterium]